MKAILSIQMKMKRVTSGEFYLFHFVYSMYVMWCVGILWWMMMRSPMKKVVIKAMN
jgi:hypothetical protein